MDFQQYPAPLVLTLQPLERLAHVIPDGTLVRPRWFHPQQYPAPLVLTPHECLKPQEMLLQVMPDGTLVSPKLLFPQQYPAPLVLTPHEWEWPTTMPNCLAKPADAVVVPSP